MVLFKLYSIFFKFLLIIIKIVVSNRLRWFYRSKLDAVQNQLHYAVGQNCRKKQVKLVVFSIVMKRKALNTFDIIM